MTVLVVGQRLGDRQKAVGEAIDRAGTEAVFIPSAQLSRESLETLPVRCVLADSPLEVRDVARVLRSNANCFGVPLVALSDHVSDRIMLELHAIGADDVVAVHDLGGLTRRLAALSSFDPRARTALFQGSCLLAHADLHRRQLFGRVLRQAGFDVSFACSMQEALTVAERSPPKVLVVSNTLPPDGGRRALARLSEHWVGDMPAVLLASGRTAGSLSPHAWTVVAEEAPPDDLLFVVNELLRPRELLESRASRRMLYATLCSFRAAGELETRLGLTYNISREGLYIRTFDAPTSRGQVWLELRPPGAARACHVRGEIVWTRTLATGARGAAPPGFGVRLSAGQGPPEDTVIYSTQYDRMLTMLGAAT
jgi:DNA-binding response OmpR family regulator